MVWHRFVSGLFSKEKSLATGLVLAFMGWTLARLVDGITTSHTIVYDVEHQATTLADGRQGFDTQVTLTNLSADTGFTNFRATLATNGKAIVFSQDRADSGCEFQAPGGMDGPDCTPRADGYSFSTPMFLAGRWVRFHAKYTVPPGSDLRPALLIQPDTTTFRLVEPGFETWVTRHQTGILLAMLVALCVMLFLSVTAGLRDADAK